MLLADARSSVQVAAAEGSTKKADLRLGAGLFGGGVGAAGGGYGNTNEGKIIAAAFMDNYNGIVGRRARRSEPAAQRRHAGAGSRAGGNKKAGAVFNEGDVLAPKIANVQLMAEASDTVEGRGHAGAHRRAGRDRRREGRLHQRPGRERVRLGEDCADEQAIVSVYGLQSRSLKGRLRHEPALFLFPEPRAQSPEPRAGYTSRRAAADGPAAPGVAVVRCSAA